MQLSKPCSVFWSLCPSYRCFLAFFCPQCCLPPCSIMNLGDLSLARWTAAYGLHRDIFSKLTFTSPSLQVQLSGQPRADDGNCFSQQIPGFLVLRAQEGERQMTVPPGLRALPRDHLPVFLCNSNWFPEGKWAMQAWNFALPSPIGTITSWSSSPWTAGPAARARLLIWNNSGRKHV